MRNFLKGFANALTIIPEDQFPKIDADAILNTSDADALKGDWEAIGKDLFEGIRQFNDDRS